MNVTVNDETRELPEDAPVAALMEELGYAARKGLAVAVNDQVVPAGEWPRRPLRDGDTVLIIQATQGG